MKFITFSFCSPSAGPVSEELSFKLAGISPRRVGAEGKWAIGLTDKGI